MKHKMLIAVGLILGIVAFATIPAMAINANGPYYSMPSWDQTLPVIARFVVLTNMKSEAVLDKETGLVWEKSPSTNLYNWISAQRICFSSTKGGRMGWRVPTLQELESLIEPTRVNPALPAGHPFSNVQLAPYWSATTSTEGPEWAWLIDFTNGNVGISNNKSTNSDYVWCVRGGQGVDPQ
jgi:hypothetical protein